MKRLKTANKTDQNKLTLKASLRKIFGKKLKKLRKEGSIPANIYGEDFKSTAVSVSEKDFVRVFRVARETGIIYVKLEDKELPILIKNVQTHPVSDQLLHADFRKIDLAKKIQTAVPVKTIGQSEAVTQKAGILLTQSETLLVESLPKDIPKFIEVDISKLKEIGQEIKVSDLAKSSTYEIKTPLSKIVVSVVAHKEESTVAETTPTAAPEVITEKVAEGEEVAPAEAGKKEVEATSPATKPAEAKAEGVKTQTPTKAAEQKK